MPSTLSIVLEGNMRMTGPQRHVLSMCLFLCVLLVAGSEVRGEVTADGIGQRCIDALEGEAKYLYPRGEDIALRGNGEEQTLLLFMSSLMGSGSTPIAALLQTPKACVRVLSAEGRDVYAEKVDGPGYPNIHISTVEGKDEDDVLHTRDVTYIWNSSEYEERDDIGQVCAEVLNRQATLLFLKEVSPIRGTDGQESLLLFMGSLTGMNTTRITAFLRTPSACVGVLSTEGRDVHAEAPDGTGYPKIYISTYSTKDITYFWNGREYTQRTE